MTCECCGRDRDLFPFGEADRTGHVWTHYVCHDCEQSCSSDDDGSPVHMLPGWPGTQETFEQFVDLTPPGSPGIT